ncbi:hypothetical protein C6P42_002400 [Pichia californica]|nr:hypothetical protein C6P42_002400 [[Candida] californica]
MNKRMKISSSQTLQTILATVNTSCESEESFLSTDMGEIASDMDLFNNNYNFYKVMSYDSSNVPQFDINNMIVTNLNTFSKLRGDMLQNLNLTDDVFSSLTAVDGCTIGEIIRRLSNLIKFSRYYTESWNNSINKTNQERKALKLRVDHNLDEAEKCLDSLDLPSVRLNLDVETRWPSLYLMLQSVVKYRDALLFLFSNDVFNSRHAHHRNLDSLKCACVSKDEFAVISILNEILEPFFVLTQISLRNHTSISCWREIITELHSTLNSYYMENQLFYIN